MMLGPILHAPCMRQLCFWFGIDAYEFDFPIAVEINA